MLLTIKYMYICISSKQEKERPEYAVELKKANTEYEKTRSQLQLFYGEYFVCVEDHFG